MAASFVEVRAQGDLNRSTFRHLLTHIARVNVRTWLSALPADIVTPDRVAAEAAEALADVPLPANFDIATMNIAGANDRYQFGVAVISRVGCAWIAEWLRAKMVGDEIALRRAAKAMGSSRHWKILHQIDDEGEWPDGFWQIADDVAEGDPPVDYRQALDCR